MFSRLTILPVVNYKLLILHLLGLLEIFLKNCTLWTDSKDVICWIQGQSRRYKTFVTNRISETNQKSNPRQWRHIPTDFKLCWWCNMRATRERTLDWLSLVQQAQVSVQEEEDSPQVKQIKVEECSEDYLDDIVKSKMIFAVEISQTWLDPLKFSSWTKLIKVAVWVLRFVAKLLAKVKKSAKPEIQFETYREVTLSPAEQDRAGLLWVKQTQMERYLKEIKELKGGKEVSKQSHLKLLTPIINELGMLQDGGLINKAEFPLLLSKSKQGSCTFSSLQFVISNSHYSSINLKAKQVKCLEAIYCGRHVVAVLLTGDGKSMIFYFLLALLHDKMRGQSLSSSQVHHCISAKCSY